MKTESNVKYEITSSKKVYWLMRWEKPNNNVIFSQDTRSIMWIDVGGRTLIDSVGQFGENPAKWLQSLHIGESEKCEQRKIDNTLNWPVEFPLFRSDHFLVGAFVFVARSLSTAIMARRPPLVSVHFDALFIYVVFGSFASFHSTWLICLFCFRMPRTLAPFFAG